MSFSRSKTKSRSRRSRRVSPATTAQQQPTKMARPTMEGSLSKWTNVMKGWQFRWFVLDDNAGLLSYYTSREKMMRGVRRGCVRLKGAVIGIDDEDDSTFTITVDSKTFHFQSRDAEEREKWIRALEDTILRHARRMRWDPSKPTPSIQEFEKKLSEADSYLQILIDQTKALESRMTKMTEDADRVRCQAIKDHADEMLESIKHSIVLLQIAKNTAHPVNGIYQPASSSSFALDASSQSMPKSLSLAADDGDAVSLQSVAMLEDVQTGIEVGAECLEARRRSTLVSLRRASLSGAS